MQFDVSVEKLIDSGLNINDYLFCQFIYQQDRKLFNFYLEQFNKFFTKESLDKLLENGFIDLLDDSKGYIFSNIIVTKYFLDTFIKVKILKKATIINDIDWFEEWYSLWPKGIKSGEIFAHSHLIAGIS